MMDLMHDLPMQRAAAQAGQPIGVIRIEGHREHSASIRPPHQPHLGDGLAGQALDQYIKSRRGEQSRDRLAGGIEFADYLGAIFAKAP
ncbi:hypothetical protein D3C87_1974670 [compost metagenome]